MFFGNKSQPPDPIFIVQELNFCDKLVLALYLEIQFFEQSLLEIAKMFSLTNQLVQSAKKQTSSKTILLYQHLPQNFTTLL